MNGRESKVVQGGLADLNKPFSIRREKGITGLKPLTEIGCGWKEPDWIKLLRNNLFCKIPAETSIKRIPVAIAWSRTLPLPTVPQP